MTAGTHTNAQIEGNIEYWSGRADRARRELEHAEQQVSLWMAKTPKDEQG